MTDLRAAILAAAQAFSGYRYRLDPPPDLADHTIDCSLFVLEAFRRAGVPFAPGIRTAEQIRQASTPIGWGEVLPGDLSIGGVGQQADSSGPRSFGCLSLVSELPEVGKFAVCPDRCTPLPGHFIPRYTPKLGCRTGGGRSILRIARRWNRTQVRPPTVQAVAVDVVAHIQAATSQLEHFSMKQNRSIVVAGTFTSARISTIVKTPRPLADPLKVFKVNGDVCTDGAVAGVQRDQRSRVVVNELDRTVRNAVIAGSRAEATSLGVGLDLTGPHQELSPTSLTLPERRGTLSGHRLTPSGGVTPPDVDASRGHLHGELYHV